MREKKEEEKPLSIIHLTYISPSLILKICLYRSVSKSLTHSHLMPCTTTAILPTINPSKIPWTGPIGQHGAERAAAVVDLTKKQRDWLRPASPFPTEKHRGVSSSITSGEMKSNTRKIIIRYHNSKSKCPAEIPKRCELSMWGCGGDFWGESVPPISTEENSDPRPLLLLSQNPSICLFAVSLSGHSVFGLWYLIMLCMCCCYTSIPPDVFYSGDYLEKRERPLCFNSVCVGKRFCGSQPILFFWWSSLGLPGHVSPVHHG